jgi:hypothetical protein
LFWYQNQCGRHNLGQHFDTRKLFFLVSVGQINGQLINSLVSNLFFWLLAKPIYKTPLATAEREARLATGASIN